MRYRAPHLGGIVRLMPGRARHARRRRLSPFAFGVVIALILGLGAGSAFAIFVSNGAGTGWAGTDFSRPVRVVGFAGGDEPAVKLLPGGPPGDVILRIDNANDFPVTLVSVTVDGPVTALDDPVCTSTGVTFTNRSGLHISLRPGSDLVDLPGLITMDTTSSNGCQGARFSIPIALTVTR